MRERKIRNLSTMITMGQPLCAILLTSALILVVIQTGSLQSTLGFAQNIADQQRNANILHHIRSLQKPNNTSDSANFHKTDSPLSVVESMRNGDNLNLSSHTLSNGGADKINATNV